MFLSSRVGRPISYFPKLASLNPRRLSSSSPSTTTDDDAAQLAKLINDQPFPSATFPSLLRHRLSPSLVDSVLGRLFSGHVNSLKALHFFNFALHTPHFRPSPACFEKILLILARSRNLDEVWDLMLQVHRNHPSLVTTKSMSIVLAKVAKNFTFEETLEAFHKMERLFAPQGFGTEEFNVLLRAFCAERHMKEARAIFTKFHSRFQPNVKTFNILLLGFKEAGNVMAMELFYHEMIRRGFKPNKVTYNIRIDAYCKKGNFADGLRVADEMEKAEIAMTLETLTTLVHGACVARNPIRARHLFDEITKRRLEPDVGIYNALLGSYVRAGELKVGVQLMDEMEEKGIPCDDVTYHTMILGTRKFGGVEDVVEVYRRMVQHAFVPKMRTVVMLMKFFCEKSRCDLGLELWHYMVEKGCCPHGHSLDLLVTGLCCSGKVEEAYKCFMQMVERGRQPSAVGYQVLEGFLVKAGEVEKLGKLGKTVKRLKTADLPSSRGHQADQIQT